MSIIKTGKGVGGHPIYKHDEVGNVFLDGDKLQIIEAEGNFDTLRKFKLKVASTFDDDVYEVVKTSPISEKGTMEKHTLKEANEILRKFYDDKNGYTTVVTNLEIIGYNGDKPKLKVIEVHTYADSNKSGQPLIRIIGKDVNGKRFTIDTREPWNYNFYEVTSMWKINPDGTKTKLKNYTPDTSFNGKRTSAPRKKFNNKNLADTFSKNFRKML